MDTIKATIWCNGDSSVGIPGCSVVVDTHYDSSALDLEFREFVRTQLKESFSAIWDDKTYVVFDDEPSTDEDSEVAPDSAGLPYSLKDKMADLLEVAKAMREWIDAVPVDVALPSMPGFDRDWADSVLEDAEKSL